MSCFPPAGEFQLSSSVDVCKHLNHEAWLLWKVRVHSRVTGLAAGSVPVPVTYVLVAVFQGMRVGDIRASARMTGRGSGARGKAS